MAALSAEEQRQVRRGLMRHWSRVTEATTFDKPELAIAVSHCDTWLDGNFTASTNEGLNVSYPTGFKTGATAAQKGLVLASVAARRVSLAALKKLLGDVN